MNKFLRSSWFLATSGSNRAAGPGNSNILRWTNVYSLQKANMNVGKDYQELIDDGEPIMQRITDTKYFVLQIQGIISCVDSLN